jgi:hydroxypyruvate reductase
VSADLRAEVEQVFQAALRRVHAGRAVATALAGTTTDRLMVAGAPLPISDAGVYGIAIGKAAPEMMAAVEQRAGDRLIDGIVVTKNRPNLTLSRSRVLLGAHPVPDQRSLDAGAAVLDFARGIPGGAIVLCLISGGGSALIEVLRDGVSLEELRDVTGRLLRAGASIHELNAVRSRLSRIKAGGLLAALGRRTVINLVVSDVLGDDVHTIASGPTVPPRAGVDADAVLQRYRAEAKLPPSAHDHAFASDPPITYVVASLSLAIDAAAKAAGSRGYTPTVLTRSIDGEAREVGRLVASVVADIRGGSSTLGPPLCLLAGGEMVVTVRGDGIGGRNTEAALAAALQLAGVERVALGFLATDGDDGATGAAGAVVDGQTVARDDGAAAAEALARNDSFPFLQRRGAVVRVPHTATNVNDLIVGLVD